MLWTVQAYNFNLGLNLPFYLNISSDGSPTVDSTIITRTNFFNITPSRRDTSGTSTTFTLSPDSTNKPTSADGKNRMIEVELGLGLGIPLLIALISIFLLVRRLRKNVKAHLEMVTKDVPIAAETNQQFSREDAPKYGPMVHEISARDEVHEVPGSSLSIRDL